MHVVSVPANLFSFLFHPLCGAFHVTQGRPTKVANVADVSGDAPNDITKGQSIARAPCFGRQFQQKQSRKKRKSNDLSNSWCNHSVCRDGGEKKNTFILIRDLKETYSRQFQFVFLDVSCFLVPNNILCFPPFVPADRCSFSKLNIKQNKEKHMWQRALFTAVDHFTVYIYICIRSWAESLSFLFLKL